MEATLTKRNLLICITRLYSVPNPLQELLLVNNTNLKNTRLVTSVEETQSIARELVGLLQGRGIISLEGPLGAGKTHFVKGAATALHLQEEVTSPTFTLLQSYGAKENILHHIDFYRLSSAAEALDMGVEECFEEGLTIIEWGNKFLNLLPPGTLRVSLQPLENDVREISWYFHSA
jgi:tRNA threonylcarbamoyladenosine biosynthesis protein TsaE